LKYKIGIFDNDVINPYGRELCNVLAFLGFQAEIFCGHKLPNGGPESTKESLKAKRKKSEFWKFMISAIRNDCSIIAWASTRQKVMLVFIGLLFRPSLLYVSHNPVLGRAPTGVRGLIEQALIKRCTNVVHGPTLSQSFWELYKLRAFVAYHPPYMSSIAPQKGKAAGALITSKNRRLVIMGRGEKNKVFPMKEFLSRLIEKCEDLTIVVTQRPRVDLGIDSDRILNLTSDCPLDEVTLYQLLASSDLVASPSSNVTESGTVILANSMSLKCVAFDSPELRKHLFPEALAKPNDLDSFLEKCVKALDSPTFESARWTPEEWMKVASESWNQAIHSAVTIRAK
jgi:hypothetical protein